VGPQLDTAKTDSDGDGVPDITELKTGKNPNVRDAPVVSGDGGVVTLPPEPVELPTAKFGCGGTIIPMAPLLLAAILWRRRKSA
jgi:hypothetical protein